jgi:hypothetical protein
VSTNLLEFSVRLVDGTLNVPLPGSGVHVGAPFTQIPMVTTPPGLPLPGVAAAIFTWMEKACDATTDPGSDPIVVTVPVFATVTTSVAAAFVLNSVSDRVADTVYLMPAPFNPAEIPHVALEPPMREIVLPPSQLTAVPFDEVMVKTIDPEGVPTAGEMGATVAVKATGSPVTGCVGGLGAVCASVMVTPPRFTVCERRPVLPVKLESPDDWAETV